MQKKENDFLRLDLNVEKFADGTESRNAHNVEIYVENIGWLDATNIESEKLNKEIEKLIASPLRSN